MYFAGKDQWAVFPYFVQMSRMYKSGIVLIGLFLLGCKGGKSGDKGFSYEKFSQLFPPAQTSYGISDADLANNKDTTVIRSPEFAKFISDSLKSRLFGKGAKVKYIALSRVKASKGTSYYIVKAMSGGKKAVLLMPFTNDQFDAVFPFLVPDNDASTTQQSTVDKSDAIVRSVSQRKASGSLAEGREVYQYIPESKAFTLVLTNPLNNAAEIINPIDTLPKKNKYSGDYVRDKKNYVSVRDGRSSKEMLFFIHIQDGDCSGEIKGTLLLTSATTAVYRQAGDPCSVDFQFSNNSVTVKEAGGCGSRRGLDCSFNGTFKKKKEPKAKPSKKKSSLK